MVVTEQKYPTVISYMNYQIGYSSDDKVHVSKDLSDARYKRIEIATVDEAYEYLDSLYSE